MNTSNNFLLEIDVFPNISKIRIPDRSTRERQLRFTQMLDLLWDSESTSFKVDGYYFSESYREGKWDGKKHLFAKGTLKFPTGLLDEITMLLELEGIAFKIYDHRDRPRPLENQSFWNTDVILRPYQDNLVAKFLETDQGIIQVATGGGKTVIATKIIQALSVRTLVIVHTKDLLYQWKDEIKNLLSIEPGQIGDGQNFSHSLVTVATMQSLKWALALDKVISKVDDTWGSAEDSEKNIDGGKIEVEDPETIEEFLKSVNFVVVDEVHLVPAETYYNLLLKIAAYYRLGLSASPWRDDGKDLMLKAAVGQIMRPKITATKLIQEGYLVPPKFKIMNCKPVEFEFGSNYQKIYSEAVSGNDIRNARIVYLAEELAISGKSVLILVKQIGHGKRIYSLIKEMCEIPSEFISGKDSAAKRKLTLDKLKSKELRILIATTVFDEGVDIPSLDCLVLAGGGISSTKALQRVGRVLRTSEGKTEAIIIEIWDHSEYLEEHFRKRTRIYKTEPGFKFELPNGKKTGPASKKVVA